MACIATCIRTARYSEAYKNRSDDLKKHILNKYNEMQRDKLDDVDLIKSLVDFIIELDKNSNFHSFTKNVDASAAANSSDEMRKELIELLKLTIKFTQSGRTCCTSSEKLKKESQVIKNKIKTFYAENKSDLKSKIGQKEFAKLFYKLIALILLKYGILNDK